MTKLRWGVTVVAVVLVAVAVVLLWPPSDPLAHVQTVAVQTSGKSRTDQADNSQQPPLVRGLEVALGDHHIRIVTDPEAADAVIAIEFDAADIHLDKNGIQATARCIVTKKNGDSGVLFLNLNVDQTGIHATLIQRRFWEFWK